jgi:hypothetical protein
MAVSASEEARQPTIRDCPQQRCVGTSLVLHGYVFIGLHEESGRKAMCTYTPIAGRWDGLWASVGLGNSRGAEKGAS